MSKKKPVASRMVDVGSRGPIVKKVQRALNKRGFRVGQIDGYFGRRTGEAVRAFRKSEGLKPSTLVNRTTYRRLKFKWNPNNKPGDLRGTPKQIINRLVLEAQRFGFDIWPGSVKAANDRHGPTVSGNRSDHQGPGNEAYAADISNGSSPTKEMDEFARYLARKLGCPNWTGSGAVSWYKNGYRMQMIYRSMVGGNHYNHIHIGIRKL